MNAIMVETVNSLEAYTYTDSDTWRDFKLGDNTAYTLLYSRYFRLLLRYGHRLYVNREFIKDCVQDLFIELWKNRHNLSQPASVKNYLLKALRNKIIRNARKDQMIKYGVKENYDHKTEPSHESQLINDQVSKEKTALLQYALKALTRRQYEAIILIYYKNTSYTETAAKMSISVDAVYNLVSKGVQMMRYELRDTKSETTYE